MRPLKWGTWRLWTPSGFKNTSSQNWTIDKNVRLSTKADVFSIVQIWRLVFLEPLGVQRRHVPHFKGLIYAKVDLEAQGRGSTFTLIMFEIFWNDNFWREIKKKLCLTLSYAGGASDHPLRNRGRLITHLPMMPGSALYNFIVLLFQIFQAKKKFWKSDY